MKIVRISRIYEYPDDLSDKRAMSDAMSSFYEEIPEFLENLEDFVSAEIIDNEEKYKRYESTI